MNEQKNTSERIIEAFIELFRDFGYKGATTRAVAERAGVNEVTIFRHFGNKKGIMDAALESVSYSPFLEKIINEDMVWDLEKDLWKIADSYHRYMVKINDLVLIGFREAQLFPELNDTIVQIPKQLKANLVSYLTEMYNRGKLIETNIEFQAMNFIWLNFGYFLSKSRFGNQVIASSQNEFLKHSIQLFARGLTP
ncbi:MULTISPECIES: TetR/AcrR family transcriptional regulator [Heyndrickxia]|uniref:TetR family transcriptional regulator n=1 Tax=Heyndrickxia oleronia TaxID=38875 RepID=A0A8E2LEU8_9BACI|nr:TetR/AcrR family transcriptional regulator [Heyndrickxia oleronia]NYV67432.1 TetR/AcrR family transcriptional regulator [Bacillus sp. Gen3]OJH16631.1 TetR family transcriptional regulator [Bacillus obstructivus]MBU5213841.1 TetR/AcrR family transcriptional regulator [Heyndrickxia oleronia]MCI1589823.1 TetR/AcrR family transcriptional regulator [Heyndrickxia oleronia]MCI1613469.1 TetR/AcrR family transcriptional regulator [Heyndrickxia oleronia]